MLVRDLQGNLYRLPTTEELQKSCPHTGRTVVGWVRNTIEIGAPPRPGDEGTTEFQCNNCGITWSTPGIHNF